jgi:hypothetical protein
VQGAQGFQGAAGTSGGGGAQGVQGAQGFQGAAGTNGAAGAQGVQGATGPGTLNSSTASYVAVYSGAQALSGYSNFSFNSGTGLVSATDFAATSDARLKNVIANVENALATISALQGVKYYWNETAGALGYDTNSPQVGFLAQDLQKLIPEAIAGTDERLSVIYDKIIPYLVEAIKELSDKVNKLENK